MDLSVLPSHLLVSTLKKVSTPTFISLNKSCKRIRQLLLEVKPQLPKIRNIIWIQRTPLNWQIGMSESVNGFSTSNTCPFSEGFEPFFDLFCKRYAGFCFKYIEARNSDYNLPATVTEKEIKMFGKIVTILADNDISCYDYIARLSPTEEVFIKLKPMNVHVCQTPELWKYTEKCGRHTSIRFCDIGISDLLLALDGRCDDCECIRMEIPEECEEIVFLELLEFMKMRKTGKRCRRLMVQLDSYAKTILDAPDSNEKFFNQKDIEVKPLKANRRFKTKGYKLAYKRLIYNGEFGTTVARLAYGITPEECNAIYFDCLDFDGKETTFPGKPFPMNISERV